MRWLAESGCASRLRPAKREVKEEENERAPSCSLVGTAGVVLPALLVILALRAFVFGLYVVPTGSMLNTIREGDYVLGEKLSLALGDPSPGDVVTFRSPEQQSVTLVKRIIATEGQSVNLRGGKVFVEGTELDEPYVLGKSLAPEEEPTVAYPHVVAEGCVWVMGDNREASRDSRWFGDISVGSITSRVVAVYWPPEDMGPIVTGEEAEKVSHAMGRLVLCAPKSVPFPTALVDLSEDNGH